jgi:hypothetical protein
MRKTLYTVDYTGIGYNAKYRRVFTDLNQAKEFAKRDFADPPVTRVYSEVKAKEVIRLAKLSDNFEGIE